MFTLLALEFAMLIFHKAVGVYFANCTITIKAQTPTHGPCIKTWNSQSIMQMQMDCQKPTSLGIIDKGHIFQTKPNLQEVEHMLVEQRFVQTPSTIRMPNCDTNTHKNTQKHTQKHTHTHTNQDPVVNSQWSIANSHWQMGNGQLSMVNGQWWVVTSQWSKANCQ